jgi:hypothetical protein
MKTSQSLIFIALLIFTSCKKNHPINPCEGKTQPTGKFIIKEMIGDTAFIADTIFRDNYVQFQALDKYETVTWKLGSDPREWTNPEFSLSFINTMGTIPIDFSGKKTPNTLCFPGDIGTYTSSQNLTVVEQVEKPYVTISPLVGKYKGYFTDSPSDKFTVRMEYFDSTKYDVTVTGSKNFYWFSNMPNGFTTTLSLPYPELKNGYSVEMGYKCFVFDYDSYHQGKAWLSNDTLYISYGSDLVGRKKFIGKKL